MEFSVVLEIAAGVIAGLGIFLLGMKYMSEGMQAVAGRRLRSMINAVTNNRLLGCLIGALVTSMIQSSSVTTVMLVGFVNAGLMSLVQTIGVILGADIGTTITGWILVLPIAKHGLPIMGFSALIYLFTKREGLRYTALMLVGLGMVFFGMQVMKDGMAPLNDNGALSDWFSRFHPDHFGGLLKCVLVGAMVTAVLQSSSATVGITMTLAGSGVIDFQTAVALVLGENIGTTVTAYLASLGASTAAKRVAYAHITMKVIAVSIVVMLFQFYFPFVESMLEAARTRGMNLSVKTGIALAHTTFNVLLVLGFLPFTRLLAKGLERWVTDKGEQETHHLSYLDVRLLETPSIGVEQSHKEMLYMAETVDRMMERMQAVMIAEKPNEQEETKIFQSEEQLDDTQRAITEFLAKLIAGSVPLEVVEQARMQLRMADEYESVSDYIVNILKMTIKIRKHGLEFDATGQAEMQELHKLVAEYLQQVHTALSNDQQPGLGDMRALGHAITRKIKLFRTAHMRRFESKEVSPLASLVFPDMLNSYRRIKDHAFNIVELLEGEK